MEKGPGRLLPRVQPTLRHWQKNPDLASVRDKAALAKLPRAQQEAWRKLWTDVEALLKKANAGKKAQDQRKP
jgi:hypothetical protein